MFHDPPDSPESKYIGGTIQEVPEKVARANPITYISADAKPPPFFLAHGKGKGAGWTAPVTHLYYPGDRARCTKYLADTSLV